MAKNRIRIIVQGDPRDKGHVRLNDFLRQLDSIRAALKQTEHLVREERSSLYYRIIEAKQKSPLTVVLECVDEQHTPELPQKVVGKFLDSISQIKKRGTIPRDFDYPTAESYREIAAPQHRHVSSLIIANSRKRVVIDEQYEEKLAKAIGPDEYAEGSVTGTLDTIKLHNRTAFEIFPTIGPKKVTCHVSPDASTDLKEKIKLGLEHYVRVYGRLRYKHWDKYPHAIDAREIEIYPPEAELPKLSDLRGSIPELTGNLTEDEFLEKASDAWKT